LVAEEAVQTDRPDLESFLAGHASDVVAGLLRSSHWLAVLVDDEARVVDASDAFVRILGEGRPVGGEPLERFLSSPTIFAELFDRDSRADEVTLSLTSRDGSLYRAEMIVVRDGCSTRCYPGTSRWRGATASR
jgi:hypothetical protein